MPFQISRYHSRSDQRNALYKNNLAVSSLSELYHQSSSATGDNATAYDKLNRLANFKRGTLSASSNNGGILDSVSSTSSLSNHNEVWSLDTLGNWSSQTVDGTATSRTHNFKNQVTAVSSNSLTFDNNGNTTTDNSGQKYVYDAWNRPVTVKNSGNTTIASYSYDAKGRRIQEAHSSTTTDLYFSTNWQVLEERQSSTITKQYVWGIAFADDLVLRDDGTGLSRRFFAQQDANWNTTALENSSGVVQERFVYDPYGNMIVLTPSGSSSTENYNWIYLHQSGRLDTTTGLYNFRHRDYAPSQGRWIQQDPAGYVDGLNIYQDLDSRPNILLDPMGLDGAGDVLFLVLDEVKAASDEYAKNHTPQSLQKLESLQDKAMDIMFSELGVGDDGLRDGLAGFADCPDCKTWYSRTVAGLQQLNGGNSGCVNCYAMNDQASGAFANCKYAVMNSVNNEFAVAVGDALVALANKAAAVCAAKSH